jgi:hypothetical protein
LIEGGEVNLQLVTGGESVDDMADRTYNLKRELSSTTWGGDGRRSNFTTKGGDMDLNARLPKREALMGRGGTNCATPQPQCKD